MNPRTSFLAALTAACILAALFVAPMAQPLDYHHFVDSRTLFGIPNALDVLSNLGFLVAGLAGLWVSVRKDTVFAASAERIPYMVFFTGVLLTSFGSSYYHLAPDNERLFWDRLPMTIAFMSLISAQIVERIDRRTGLALLAPMLLVGAVSVLYWRATERAGAGNVIPYGILQSYAVVVLLMLAVLHKSRYTRGTDLYGVFACYVLAKVLEAADTQIFALGNLVSGHTLKHLAAGVAGLVVCRMLRQRALAGSPAG